MNYILIDTSYLIFYRYFALIQWWGFSKPPEEQLTNPAENEEFREKFKKAIIESVENIKHMLKLHTNKRQSPSVKVIMARDCPRKNIWRNEYYDGYKATREKDDNFMGGEFFKMTYQEKLLEQTGCDLIIQEPKLEADDIIAITTNYLKSLKDTENIYIVANDMDYLQLWDDKCDIINLKKQRLIENKKSFPDGAKNLFIKIILGDKSDNIIPVFKKCGVKEAEDMYDDVTGKKLENKLSRENAYERLLLNKILVDFDEIPDYYIDRVLKKIKL